MTPSKTDMCRVNCLKFRTVCLEDSLSPNVFLTKKEAAYPQKKKKKKIYIYIYIYNNNKTQTQKRKRHIFPD